MGYNAKDIMKTIFDELISYSFIYSNFDEDDQLLNQVRYIKGNQNDVNILSRTKLSEEKYWYVPNSLSFKLIDNDQPYLVIICESIIENLPYNISSINIPNGLLASAIFHSKVVIKKNLNRNEIYNSIAWQYSGNENYDGHEIQDILNVLTPINIFKIDKFQNRSLLTILGSLVAKNKNFMSLDFVEDNLLQIENMFSFGPDSIPYRNLLNSLLSATYEHSFFELYKCIEALYQVIFIVDLYDEIKPSCNLIDFLEATETKLNWRPYERTSIQKLFSRTPIYLFMDINFMDNTDPEKLANWIYDLRNRVVHLKQLQKSSSLSVGNWNSIMKFVLRLLEYWYSKYDSRLETASNNVYEIIAP